MPIKKSLIVIGDRALILPDERKERTSLGLYLPQGVEEKEKVQAGTVIKVGPGYPLPDMTAPDDEPWMNTRRHQPKFIPVQAQEGDYAIFLRKSSVEVEYDGINYLIVPQSAILVLLRDEYSDAD
jgi:chaperonin GroES